MYDTRFTDSDELLSDLRLSISFIARQQILDISSLLSVDTLPPSLNQYGRTRRSDVSDKGV